MRQILLRNLMVCDGLVLVLLGALLIFVPERLAEGFDFRNLPEGVNYIFGLWGCGLATMGLGYVVAARRPIRNLAWIQVGIVRGAFECAFGVVCVGRGLVAFRQASLGIVVGGLLALGYVLLYPRRPRLVPGVQTAAPKRRGG